MSEKTRMRDIDPAVCDYITENLRGSIDALDDAIAELKAVERNLQSLKDSFTKLPDFPKGINNGRKK
jgi:acetate kinase